MIRTRPKTPAELAASLSPAPQATSCRETLTRRMAEQMREMAFAGETVSIETLVARGWTRETATALAPAATTLARRLSIRQVA